VDELHGELGLRHEDVHGQLAHTARQHPHGLDLRIVHVDHLAGQRAELRPPEGEVLDDALELEPGDRDRVADGVPPLDEHRRPGDDVGEQALDREADQDQEERGAGDGGEAVDAPRELRHGHDGRSGEG
jgi:hypothetical protein